MIENIVFSGGSTKGLCFIGTIKYLEELNILDNITNYAGSSVGSFISFLVLLGYRYNELNNLFMKIDLDKFTNIDSTNLINFFDNYGIDPGDKITKTLKIFLKRKLNCEDITFSDLYLKTNKLFTVTGSCLNNLACEYFNKVNTPNMSVLTAIRISISVPLLYQPVKYNDKYYVDGALTDNFAIDLFENDNKKTIGFVLVSNDLYNNEINSIEHFFLSLIWTSTAHQLKNKIEKYKDITIQIEANINSFDFSIKKEQKISLINQGYEITKKNIIKQFSYLLNK